MVPRPAVPARVAALRRLLAADLAAGAPAADAPQPAASVGSVPPPDRGGTPPSPTPSQAEPGSPPSPSAPVSRKKIKIRNVDYPVEIKMLQDELARIRGFRRGGERVKKQERHLAQQISSLQLAHSTQLQLAASEVAGRSMLSAVRVGSSDGRVKRGWVPTAAERGFVAGARCVGGSIKSIGMILGVPEEVLNRKFPSELAMDVEYGVVCAGVRLLERGLVDGDVGALRYYLSTHGGSEWREQNMKMGVGFGTDGAGRQVVTFVVEGLGGSDEIGEGMSGGSTIDHVGPVSER